MEKKKRQIKINIDTKKSAEAVSNIVHKTSDISKKAAVAVQKGAKSISEKSKNDSYLRRMKKFNPLFPEQYLSQDFHIPNMIMIVDDAVRRGIDVCEGAIGWLNKNKEMEVFYLYDEAVEMTGIKFIPTATCEGIYYVDNFDRKRFIRIDYIFSKAHEERMAELKHIAYSLGAKHCSIELCEASKEVRTDKRKTELEETGAHGFASSKESAERDMFYKGSDRREGRIEIQFEGNDVPAKPELKWFAHDENIIKLVEMRCKGSNHIKKEVLELSGASSATMSQKTAYAIDTAVKSMGIKGNSAMESQATRENSSKLVYCIEF